MTSLQGFWETWGRGVQPKYMTPEEYEQYQKAWQRDYYQRNREECIARQKIYNARSDYQKRKRWWAERPKIVEVYNVRTFGELPAGKFEAAMKQIIDRKRRLII
jgi:hypothetical protein